MQRTPAKSLLEKSKVWALRKYYRVLNYLAWRHESFNASYHTQSIHTRSGEIASRVYESQGGANKPLIVYFHGGGWVIGDLDTHHPFCLALRERTGCTVVAVDYRLAPEHPFPAAQDDCLDATHWIIEHSQSLGTSNGTVVLAGDSAGANLATCTCLSLEADARSKVVGEILLYPVVDHYQSDYFSYFEYAKGHALTSDLLVWFWDSYLNSHNTIDETMSRSMPMRSANLDSLPATFVVTAEYDPLKDEGIAYADKVSDAGVKVQHHHFENAAHGFVCSDGVTDDFDAVMNHLVDWLAGSVAPKL